MPVYQIKVPNGKVYDIYGPEGATDDQLFEAANQYMQEEQTAADNKLVSDYYKSKIGVGENIMSGLGSGFTNTLETGALGLATLMDEENELAAREVIQSIGDKFTPEGGDPDSIIYGLANTFSLIAVALFVGNIYLIRFLYRKFRGNMNIKEKLASIKSKTIDKIIAKADTKIKERELLSLKAELAREHKNIDDYNNEEIDLILRDKREKVIAKIKDKSLLGLLITLVIGI